MPFTNRGSTPALAMASRTLSPGPSASPKFPKVSVAVLSPLTVGELGVGLEAAFGIVDSAGLGEPPPQAAIAAVINVESATRIRK